MPRVRQFQTNFTAGELDPFLFARVDTEQYFNGAARMRNVFVVPQGGFIRRDGLEFRDELPRQLNEDQPSDLFAAFTITAPNGGVVANLTDEDVATLFTTTTDMNGGPDPYVVFQLDAGVGMTEPIMFFDVLGAFLSSSVQFSQSVQFQYSDDGSTWFNFGATPTISRPGAGGGPGHMPLVFGPAGAANERSIRFTADIGPDPQPEDRRFYRLVVDPNTAGIATFFNVREIQAFTYATVGSVSNCRIIPFQFSITQRYVHVITDRNIRVYKDGDVLIDIPSPYIDKSLPTAAPPISLITSDIPFINWAQDLDTLILALAEEDPRRVIRQGGDTQWDLQFVPLTNIPQFDFGAGAEDVWSQTRGWPVSVIFFQGRMWFAGSLSRPQTIWASKSLDFFNFDVGTAMDDEAIDVTADTDEVNSFTQINAGRHLQFFATSGEFYIPNSDTEALTPTNVIIRRTTRRGISNTVRDTTAAERALFANISSPGDTIATGHPRVAELDGAVLFAQRGGKSLREFLFTDTELAYRSENLTLLSSELVRNPTNIALRKSTSTQEADFLLMPNFIDGTLSIFVTLRAQAVRAMTLHDTPGGGSTEGVFKDCGVDLDMIYHCVDRTINGALRSYFERFEAALHMDAGSLITLMNYGLKYSPTAGFSEVTGTTAAVDVGSADFSVEYWLREDGTSLDHEHIVGRGSGTGIATHWKTGTTSGRPYFSIGDGAAGVAAEFTASISIDDGLPHHLVWTFDRVNDEATVYVDRNFQETIDISAVTGAVDTANIIVGASAGTGGATDDADYLIDEIRLYTRLLGAAEIDEHFRSIFNNNTGLVWFLPCDDQKIILLGTELTLNQAPGQTGINDLDLQASGAANVAYEAFAPPGHIDTIPNLDQLEGEVVEIRRAGLVQAVQTVTNGEITVTVGEGQSGDITVEVGLGFTDRVLVRTMPVDANLPEGTIIGKKKRVVSVTLKVKDTEHLNVGIPNFPTNQVPFRSLGSGLLDVALTPFTGEKKVEGMLGFTEEGQVEITQSVPADMTVLGLAQRVAV